MPTAISQRSQGFWSQLGESFLQTTDIALSGAAGAIQQHFQQQQAATTPAQQKTPTPQEQQSGFNISKNFSGLGMIAGVAVTLLVIVQVIYAPRR